MERRNKRKNCNFVWIIFYDYLINVVPFSSSIPQRRRSTYEQNICSDEIHYVCLSIIHDQFDSIPWVRLGVYSVNKFGRRNRPTERFISKLKFSNWLFSSFGELSNSARVVFAIRLLRLLDFLFSKCFSRIYNHERTYVLTSNGLVLSVCLTVRLYACAWMGICFAIGNWNIDFRFFSHTVFPIFLYVSAMFTRAING